MDVRTSGLEIVGDVPWGTHFCQFYRTPRDLLDILVPYFAAGLRNNECCIWVTSEHLGAAAATEALAAALPTFDEYVRRGQIEILPHPDWYLEGGTFDTARVLAGWSRKLEGALAASFAGLRISGTCFYHEPRGWRAFTDYEAAVDRVIDRHKILAVCTYSLDRCGTAEVMDVIRNHRFALVPRNGRWDLIESGESRRVRKELRRLAQLPKQAEDALRRSEERLKRTQEIAHLGSWELDLTADRLTWSDEVYRIFGLAPSEFKVSYEAFLERVHPEDRAAVDAAYIGSLRDNQDVYEIEHRIVRRSDGETRIVHERCEHQRDAAGRIVRSVGMVHDVTERRRSEALRLALAEQERLRLGAAVEQASDAIIMADLDGTIRYVNAAFETINGLPRDQAVGRSYLDLVATDPLAEAIRNAIAQGRPWHGHLVRPVAGGRPKEIEVTISAAADPSGGLLGALINEKDVTVENALQRQIRQSQKMEALGTLAGGITHDFNNILGAIIINTELALLDLDLSHPAQGPLPLVLKAANRGKELVRQIITFSRQREWDRAPVETGPIVSEAMKFLRSTLPKTIAIHETIDADGCAILGDPSHIHQIVINLCQNAALAMRDQGGSLEVRLEAVEVDQTLIDRHPALKPGPHVRLTVADSGCGMSRDLVERIFEPFFTTRAPGEGTGLGLAVVHGIVQSYRGAIAVYSEPGRGSVFNVYLPRLESEARAAAKSAIAAGCGERILLVEDEEAQRLSLSRSLQKLGYRVSARAGGRSALSVFRKDPAAFDLIVTDQTMPGMSGLELAAAVSKIRPDVPIVLCTGFSENVNDVSARQQGIREFLMKPFTLQEISAIVRKALESVRKA